MFINFDQLQQVMRSGRTVLVDVREAYELTMDGKIPTSVHLPVGQISQFSKRVPCSKDDSVVLYCRTGARASGAASLLKRMGYKRIFVFPGGIREWSANQ